MSFGRLERVGESASLVSQIAKTRHCFGVPSAGFELIKIARLAMTKCRTAVIYPLLPPILAISRAIQSAASSTSPLGSITQCSINCVNSRERRKTFSAACGKSERPNSRSLAKANTRASIAGRIGSIASQTSELRPRFGLCRKPSGRIRPLAVNALASRPASTT